METYLSPGVQLLLSGLLTAFALWLREVITKRSLAATQENLQTTLENLRLAAEVTVQELAASKEADRAQAAVLEKVATAAAATQTAQMVIGAKVDGQMSALHTEIAELRNALVAAKLAEANEKEKASTLATQTEKDRGEATAKLTAALQAPVVPEASTPVGKVTIPAVTVPVQESALSVEPSRIVTP